LSFRDLFPFSFFRKGELFSFFWRLSSNYAAPQLDRFLVFFSPPSLNCLRLLRSLFTFLFLHTFPLSPFFLFLNAFLSDRYADICHVLIGARVPTVRTLVVLICIPTCLPFRCLFSFHYRVSAAFSFLSPLSFPDFFPAISKAGKALEEHCKCSPGQFGGGSCCDFFFAERSCLTV